jgi:hypothetical protein
MPAIERIFHLGKKPYDYPLDAGRSLILIGRSIYDPDKKECELEFYYLEVGSLVDINLKDALIDAKKLGSYKVRSDKFKYGVFEDFDAQRYLKSRYRDLIRLAHRQSNKMNVIGIFEEASKICCK